MSGTASAGERRASPWKGLALVLAVALGLRLFVILAPPDDLFDHGRVPQEELLRGNAAKEFIDGPLAPIQDYQVNHFWGGSLVVSLMAVPTFLVLGPTVVALRSVSLVFSLAAVWLAFLIVDRWGSRRAAWYAAWLLALAPPGYAISSCTLYGTHLESNALALGIVYLYLRRRETGRGVVNSLVLGCACGFALWFGYGLLVVILATLLFELMEDALFWMRRPFLGYLAGFALGFLPYVRYMWLHPGRAFQVYDVSLTRHFELGIAVGRPWTKLCDFFARDWAESFWFPRTLGLDGAWLGTALVIVLVALLGWYAWHRITNFLRAWRASRSSRAGERPAAGPGAIAGVFVLLLLCAYCLSDFTIGVRTWVQNFRYLMPLWPFVAILAALAVAELASRSVRAGRIATAAVVLACLAFGAGTLVRCDPSRVRTNWSTPGTSDDYLLRFLLLHFGQDAERMDSVVARIRETRTPAEQDRLIRELARGLHALVKSGRENPAQGAESSSNFAHMLEHLRDTLPSEYRAIFEPDPSPH